MSLYVKTKRTYKASTRVWFRCDQCGSYGDYSVGTLNDDDAMGLFHSLAAHHNCDNADLVAAVFE